MARSIAICLSILTAYTYTVSVANGALLDPVLETTSGLSSNPDDVKFYIFKDHTNMSDYKEVQYGNVVSLMASGFQTELDSVIFVIHGFYTDIFELPYPLNVVKAYLRVGTASNVVVVDWSRLGNPALGNPLWYPVAASHVPIVGKRIGELIKWLWNIGGISDPSHVHCVGHSLGAHVSAEAGNYVQALGSSIGRISGLDPAGPGFQWTPQEHRLDASDANFVVTHHTSVGFGYIGDIGHCSFYLNGGGPSQPNCDVIQDITGICPHNKAGEYYAYSILYPNTYGCKCSGVAGFKTMCNPDCNERAIFGEHTPTSTRGSYDQRLFTTEADVE